MINLFTKIFEKLRIIIKKIYYKLKYKGRVKFGKNVTFRKGFEIRIENNGIIEIGDNNFFNNYCSINCLEHVTIGNNNLFGEAVKIYDHNHIFNGEDFQIAKEFSTNSITIKDYNWIGSNVVLLKNASMDNRNVIGAGVVLNEKIDSFNLIKYSKQSFEKEKVVKR